MTLVEIGTCQALLRVVGVDPLGHRSIRSIVDRMPVSICESSIQVAEIPADSYLECIIRRLADIADVGDATNPVKRPGRISGGPASDRQMRRNRSAHRLTVHSAGIARRSRPRDAAAIIRGYRLSGGVRVERGRQRLELVVFGSDGQFSAETADVRHLQDRVAWQFPLYGQIVLLDVGPDGMGWNREQA